MQRNAEYDVFNVPLGDIYVDPGFNCRNFFTPQSVKSLADNIAQVGRIEIPVIVQRREDSRMPFKQPFRLVAGFRRYEAVRVFLKWPTIPAHIRIGLDDRAAEILNVTENFERKDLNPLEEAQALARRFPGGASLRVIAKEMNRDTRWVHQRLRLLELPEDLREKVAANMLTLLDVEMLVQMPLEKQAQAADELIAARGRNKRKLIVNPSFRRKFRMQRGKVDINARIQQLMELGLDGLATRFGAWCAGYISDDDLDKDIADEIVKKHGPNFAISVSSL